MEIEIKIEILSVAKTGSLCRLISDGNLAKFTKKGFKVMFSINFWHMKIFAAVGQIHKSVDIGTNYTKLVNVFYIRPKATLAL